MIHSLESDPTLMLLLAVQAGDSVSITHWSARGADIEAQDSDGSTPLMVAVASGDAPCVQALLAAKADPNATDGALWTPLIHAALANRGFECAELLLAAGARIDKKGLDGRDALAAARDEADAEFTAALSAHADAARLRAELLQTIPAAEAKSPKTRV